MFRKARQPGLDERYRDSDGQTRRKNSNTEIGSLRRTYGADFARPYRSDMRLDTLLRRSGAASLSDYLKRSGQS